MKKIIIILILILIAVYAALAILGRGGEYAAEKLFYQALKINKEITINPDVAPPKMLASVERTFKTILEKYPNSKTAKMTRMALAEFYIMNEKYDEALLTLNVVIDTENQDVSTLSKAHFFKGVVYEKKDEWDKALEEYVILRDEYTNTQLGLQVPIYIGRHYAGKGKEAEADKAYREAALFYDKLEKDNRGKVLGYTSLVLLRDTYLSLREYEQAGRVIEDLINNYPSQLTFAQQLPLVEAIFVNALKKPEKAIEIYKSVKEKTEDEKLIEALDRAVEKLEAKTP